MDGYGNTFEYLDGVWAKIFHGFHDEREEMSSLII